MQWFAFLDSTLKPESWAVDEDQGRSYHGTQSPSGALSPRHRGHNHKRKLDVCERSRGRYPGEFLRHGGAIGDVLIQEIAQFCVERERDSGRETNAVLGDECFRCATNNVSIIALFAVASTKCICYEEFQSVAMLSAPGRVGKAVA